MVIIHLSLIIPKNIRFISSVLRVVLYSLRIVASPFLLMFSLSLCWERCWIIVLACIHEVDSSDMAFQIAGGMALRKGILEASPVLLEPVMEVEVIIPDDCMGAINGDLSSRRGRVQGMEQAGKYEKIKAQVPLSEMLRYATDLRSMTHGRGSYSMSFSHYEEVPQRITEKIIAQSKKAEKEE